MSSVWMKLKQKQNSHVGTIVSLLWGLYNVWKLMLLAM